MRGPASVQVRDELHTHTQSMCAEAAGAGGVGAPLSLTAEVIVQQEAAGLRRGDRWEDDEAMRWAGCQWATRIGVKEPRVRSRMLEIQ